MLPLPAKLMRPQMPPMQGNPGSSGNPKGFGARPRGASSAVWEAVCHRQVLCSPAVHSVVMVLEQQLLLPAALLVGFVVEHQHRRSPRTLACRLEPREWWEDSLAAPPQSHGPRGSVWQKELPIRCWILPGPLVDHLVAEVARNLLVSS